ncbi:MAG: hypothetical protein WCZ89_07020 [Phycisphaerae bacterium]
MRLTEKQVINSFKQLYGKSKPFRITMRKSQVAKSAVQVDAIGAVELEKGKCAEAAIAFVTVASPQNLLNKSIILKQAVKNLNKKNVIPLIAAPYIGDKQMKILDETGISWVDLCGNAKINIAGFAYIERLGNKNKFPDTAPIKKIFQGTSSLVSRALLLNPEGFKSQYELVDFINSRNGKITVSTVSRVLKELSNELLAIQDKTSIRAIDAKSILNRLEQNYNLYADRQNVYRFAIDGFEKLFTIFYPAAEFVACGFYAAKLQGLAVTDETILCVKSIDKFKDECKKALVLLKPDAEFGNFKIIENNDPGLWFNISGEPIPQVDDIELCIEMTADKPRGPKVAQVLRERILKGFSK